MRYFFGLLIAFWIPAYPDIPPQSPVNPAGDQAPTSASAAASTGTSSSVSPSASVTISQSAQQLTQVKSFFADGTYDNLANPNSGISQAELPEK